MDRIPTTDSPPSGPTQPAPLIEEQLFEGEDHQDWGDLVDSDEEPDVEFVCEDINLYPRGFCYPISIGEIIVERYRIIHKLGHGAFSTAWMAQDMLENRDVALKILMLGSPDDHLNTANIMYTLRPLNRSISEKYKRIGRPRKMKLWTEQWKDGELVMPRKAKEEFIGDSIVLGDFGLAHKAGASTQKMQSPATYCAPERVHNISPSYGSDVWSYMCIFFELYTGTYLFHGWGHASVVSSIVHTLGSLPESWKGTYHRPVRVHPWAIDQRRAAPDARTL
ncbi:hypothetical protein FPRO05_07260 [Fusarium proliferatum]|uniref:non-specific serine/threonine protein kinase n=1 Tax=Gibberella intermedia TaxID=948311 RepID=A0A365MKA8_GIBIN|nr:hypothetical protein FPRO05_07260 [Fusarium proliferatum]